MLAVHLQNNSWTRLFLFLFTENDTVAKIWFVRLITSHAFWHVKPNGSLISDWTMLTWRWRRPVKFCQIVQPIFDVFLYWRNRCWIRNRRRGSVHVFQSFSYALKFSLTLPASYELMIHFELHSKRKINKWKWNEMLIYSSHIQFSPCINMYWKQ